MIVTENDPVVAVSLHVNTEVAEVVCPPKVTLVGLREQVMPVGGATLGARLTELENPSSPFTVTVDV